MENRAQMVTFWFTDKNSKPTRSVEAVVSYVSTHGSSVDEQVQTVFDHELEYTTVTSPTFPLFASSEIGLPWKETVHGRTQRGFEGGSRNPAGVWGAL